MVEAPAPSAAASCAIPCATIEIALGAAVVRVGPGNRRCDADEGAAGGEGGDVITVPAGVRILVATKPVDFRRGADSLAGLAKEELQRDPFSGTIFVFRSKRADRLKILAWDGSGLILYWKRLEEGAFRWPPISDGVMRLSASCGCRPRNSPRSSTASTGRVFMRGIFRRRRPRREACAQRLISLPNCEQIWILCWS